ERAVPDRGQRGQQLAQVGRVDGAARRRRALLSQRGHCLAPLVCGCLGLSSRPANAQRRNRPGHRSVWHDRSAVPHPPEGLDRTVTTLGALGVHATFAPTAESIAVARRMVRKALAGWPIGDLVDDALLGVSGLCTNAVIHAGTEFSVSCCHLGAAIRLAVRDSYPGRGLPTDLAAPEGQRTSGRGLLLCAAVSTAWGVDYDRSGKV